MKYILIISILFSALLSGAQGGFRSRIYLHGAPDNQAKAIFEMSPGNYVAAGWAADTVGWPQEINRLTLMGLDSVGTLKWYKQYGSFDFFYKNNIFISRSYYRQGDNLFYTGTVQDSTSIRHKGVLIKFDANGDTLWQKIYRDPDPDVDVIPQMVTASVDGGFLITGFFQHWGDGRRCLLIKTDSQGNELWRKNISKAPPNVQDGKAIVQDSATKKIVIVGYQYPYSNATHHNILVLDSLGNKLHQGSFGAGNPLDLIQSKDKFFYMTGFRSSDQNNIITVSPFVAKFSLADPGTKIWHKEYKPVSLRSGFYTIREVEGGFLLGGSLDTTEVLTGFPNDHLRLVKIDSNGNLLSDRTYSYALNTNANGSNTFGPRSLELTSDGGCVVANEIYNNPRPNPFFFVKFDSNGCDSSSSYCENLVAGQKEVEAGSFSFGLFPNPANNTTRVSFPSVSNKNYSVVLNDVTGKEVLQKRQCKSEDTLDLDNLQNGLYFVTLYEAGKTVGTKKLLVQR